MARAVTQEIKIFDARPYLEEIKKCAKPDMLPELEDHHYAILEDLELKKGAELATNRTAFIINEVYRYAKEQKVLRMAHMGETRGGKSEGAVAFALLHAHYFNKFFLEGHYDNVDVDLPKKPIVLTVNNIHRNDSEYINYVRDSFKAGTLTYGEVNVIDEKETRSGGLGTMSEQIEIENFNSIAAKYNLGEQWINPKTFIEMNTNYGIHWFIKDIKRRVNFGLLYRLENWSKGINPQTFLGWVCMPLHPNQQLRKDYEKKKNDWINKVIGGSGDLRAELRFKAAEVVAEHPQFMKMKSEKTFLLTNDQHLDIIDQLIVSGKIPAFNQEERVRIMGTAQLLVKKKLYPTVYSE